MPEYDPPNAFYTQISVPKYIKPEVFIGKEGCHLKRMTELSGCDYLWYDFARDVVEVWGKEHRLPKALKMLKKRIDSFSPPLPTDPHPSKGSIEFESDTLKVTYHWCPPFNVKYTLSGSESEAMKYYFEKILSEYPNNPYFTQIEKKGIMNGTFEMVIKRSNTSD
jgi:hypothetical protein